MNLSKIRNIFGKFIPKSIKNKLRVFVLKGNNVFCPICKSNFICFLPHGIKKRANARCPKCGSLERTRLIYLYFCNKTDVFQSSYQLLHVAPEKSLLSVFIENKSLSYYPVDKFEKGYKHDKRTRYADITDIKFDDAFFDIILCSHVLEHVTDDKKALNELYRVMKPGGWGIIQVPINEELDKTFEDPGITDPAERIKCFGKSDHLRAYGKDYGARLKEAGFSVDENLFINTFSYEEQFKYGLPRENKKLYVVKKAIY